MSSFFQFKHHYKLQREKFQSSFSKKTNECLNLSQFAGQIFMYSNNIVEINTACYRIKDEVPFLLTLEG